MAEILSMDVIYNYALGLCGLLFAPVIIIITLVFRRKLKRKFWILLIVGIVLLSVEIYFVNIAFQYERNLAKQREEQRLVSEQKEKKYFEENRIRALEVPKEVIKTCLDVNGRIADRDEKWEYSDAIMDPNLPRSKMLLACKYADGSWYLKCEKGGFSLRHLQFRITKDAKSQWQSIQLSGDEKDFCPGDSSK